MVLNILIVDDEAETRSELAEYLNYKGYQVEEAADGLEGLRKFEAAPTIALITDIKMPNLDGHEFLSRLRRLDSRVPVIVITGHYSPIDLDKAKEFENTVIMKKPCRLRDIARQLKRMVEPADA